MASTLDERIKNMDLPVDLSKDKFRAQYGTFQSEDSQSAATESISPTIEQLLEEMSAPIIEPISAIDSKIINKIVKAYQLKLKDAAESRGIKRKRESDAAITEPHKKRKESSESELVTSEDYKKLMEDAKQLKRQGDEHKHTSEGVEYYMHSALTYTRATLARDLDLTSRVALYRATAALLGPSITTCQSRGDETRAALCYTVMAFCYARTFMLQRDKCEHDVRHLSELTAGGNKTLSATLEDLFRCLELWDKARKYDAVSGSAHPLDLRTSELIDHVTKHLEALKQ